MSDLHYRTFSLQRGKFDAGKREVEISFSSEFPVMRGGVREVLHHELGAADFSRLNAGAAVLLNHDHERLVGAVVPGTARIDGDRIGRAIIRFSQSAAAIINDVADGIRNAVSIGYRLTRIVSRETQDGVETIRYAFEPYETSLVSVAADPRIGVGRSADFSATKTQQKDSKLWSPKEQNLTKTPQKFSEDEASFRQTPTVYWTWARRGQQPQIPTRGQRDTQKILGAVGVPKGDFVWRHQTEYFNGQT